MLTSQSARRHFKVLIVLASIIIAFQLAAAVVMFVGKYYGFSGSSPLSCTITGTYWILKFKSQDQFAISFIGIILSFLGTLAVLLIVIRQLLALNSLSDKQGMQKCQQSIQATTIVLFILIAFSFLAVLVPLGWFSTLIIQIKSACDLSINLYWLIIAGAAGVAEVLLLVCLILVLKMRNSMQEEKKQEQNPQKQSGQKQNEKVSKQIQGGIANKEQQQKVPLLQKQKIQENMKTNTVNQSPQLLNHRFITEKRQPEPIEAKYQQTSIRQQLPISAPIMKQRGKITQGIQTESPNNYSRFLNEPKEYKLQKTRPDTPQSVSITLNLPNGYPNGQVIAHQQVSDSSSNDSIRKKSNSKHRIQRKQKREVIKQSMEEQLSSDSDDHYYKRARKSKKKKFNYGQTQNKKRKNMEENYEKDYDRIPSRFNATPSEPKYVVLSPQSMRNFYDFMKNDHLSENKKSHKTFSKHGQRQKKQMKNNLLRPNSFVQSQVKQYKDYEQFSRRQQSKQKSIYQKLDVVQDSDDGLKKYQAFFKSSRVLKNQQPVNGSKSEYDAYFKVLNKSNAGSKDLINAQAQNYRSISNYSSVLNNQNNGKMPIQRQVHHKINLQENKIRTKGKIPQKNSLIDQIRSKYA